MCFPVTIGWVTYALLRLNTDLTVLAYLNSGGDIQVNTAEKLNFNAWNHIHLSVNEGQWYVTINGGITQNMGLSTNVNNGGNVCLIGCIDSDVNSNEVINGYMSDVYFVEGQALDCTAFGKDYDGLWGPLNSETILNNITRNESPYDQRPNMEEKWSDDLDPEDSFGSGSSAADAFDGDPDTGAQSTSSNSYVTFDRTFTNVTSLQIQTRRSGNPNPSVITGAGIEETTITSGDSKVLTNIPLTSTTVGPITITGTSNAAGGLARIAINGRVLVDGPADNSQNWSDDMGLAPSAPQTGIPQNAFDGKTSTVFGSVTNSGSGS